MPLHTLVARWLLADPVYLATAQQQRRWKNYHMSSENTVFLLGGRLRTARQRPINAAVALVIVAAGVLFYVFEAAWLWHSVSPAVPLVFAYLWLLTLATFVQASTSDAGVAPRNLHLPYSLPAMRTHSGPAEYFHSVSLPYWNTTHGTLVKYCPTCHVWRAPRMSHCSSCNTCVFHHDHHCVFLNNCVGARNYRYFLWFLLLASLSATYLATVSFVQLFSYRWRHTHTSFAAAAAAYPVSVLLAVVGLVAVVYPLMLLALHLFLTANNLSTREYLNYVRATRHSPPADRYVNVYTQGLYRRNLWLNWVASPRMVPVVRSRDLYTVGDVRLEKIDPLTQAP